MWRLIPLAKMTLRMTVFGLLLGALEFLLKTQLPWFGYPAEGMFPADGLPALNRQPDAGPGAGGPVCGLRRPLASPGRQAGIVPLRPPYPLLGTVVSLLLVQPPFHLTFLLDEAAAGRLQCVDSFCQL